MYVVNNKVITLILGSPGSGKSTYAAKIVHLANKQNIPVFCNYPTLGAYPVDMKTMIDYNLADTTECGKAILIIDEAGLHYNSRSSTQKGNKDFSASVYHWYATTRHRNTQVFIIVQSWKRVDTILRELATEVILCKKVGLFPSFTSLRAYESETTLIEDYNGNALDFQELFAKINWRCFWRPNYYHMFNSHHLDIEYKRPDWELYEEEQFPQKLPFWRRLLGLPARAPDTGGLSAQEGGSGEERVLLSDGENDSPAA